MLRILMRACLTHHRQLDDRLEQCGCSKRITQLQGMTGAVYQPAQHAAERTPCICQSTICPAASYIHLSSILMQGQLHAHNETV